MRFRISIILPTFGVQIGVYNTYIECIDISGLCCRRVEGCPWTSEIRIILL